MDRYVWELHAAVVELAHARGLRGFEVHYADSGQKIEIELAWPPANDVDLAAPAPASSSSEKLC